MLTSIGDAVITTDMAGRVTFMNPVAEALTCWTQDQALSHDIAEILSIIDATTRQPIENPVTQVLRERTATGVANHALLVAKDRTERPIDDSAAPITNSTGEVIGVVLVFRDATERRQTENLLSRYQLLSEHARDIMLFIRTDGRIIEANHAAVATYGYPRDVLCSMHISDLRDPTTAASIEPQMTQADSEGILFETIHRRSDGCTFPVEVSSRGAVIGNERILLSIIRDITTRKQIEARQHFLTEASIALDESMDYQSRLETIARLVVPTLADWCTIDLVAEDGSLDQLTVAHRDPAKVAWAKALHRGYSPDPQAQHGVPQVIRTGRSELYPEVTDEMLAKTARDAEELELWRKVGFTSVVIAPLSARGHTLGAITFVSAESGHHYGAADLALAEELARRAALAIDNARLYQAEQRARAEAQDAVRVRDAFLSIAAHELKTPLTSILGYVQLFQRRSQRGGYVPEHDQRVLSAINEQVIRLNKMVQALLDISRIETGQLAIERAPLDICALTRRVVEEIQAAVDTLTLHFSCPSKPLIVQGDELRLEQVLQNLIQNAIKYTPSNEPITVRVEQREDQVCIAVIDHGIGIPQADLPHLFQRFYRANNAEEQHISGMGIGLYVVKEIVNLHGGQVEVESIEGVGSTFTVYLPLQAQDVAVVDAD